MFSLMAICYLFLGGAGAGAVCVLAFLSLLVPRERIAASRLSVSGRRRRSVAYVPAVYRRFFAPGFAVSFMAVALGALLLVVDLGKSNRAVLLFELPTLSLVTFGSFAILTCLILTALLAVFWGLPSVHCRMGLLRVVSILALVAGISVAVYTGLLLSDMKAVPLWATPVLPLLFAVSSLSCGCAVVVGTACFSGTLSVFGSVLRQVANADAALLVLETALLVAFFAAAFAHPYDVARMGALELLTGVYAPLFLGGLGLIGIVLPFTFEVASTTFRHRWPSLVLVSSIGVLIGGFVLRYGIVLAGVHPSVYAVVL